MELQEFVNENLAKGEVNFAYYKKNGELRIARGTTSLEQIPEESHPKGTNIEKSNTKAYWDLDVGGWRTFNPLCLVWAQGYSHPVLTTEENIKINKYLENN